MQVSSLDGTSLSSLNVHKLYIKYKISKKNTNQQKHIVARGITTNN